MRRERCWVAAFCVFSLGGCIYTGSARDFSPEALRNERGWVAIDGIRPIRQRASHDCGPAALQMVLEYWKHAAPTESVLEDRRWSAAELRDRARASGLQAYVVEGTVADLVYELKRKRPVIVGLAKPTGTGTLAHYEVVVGVHPTKQSVATLDPSSGWRQNSFGGFLREWLATGNVLLVVAPKRTQ